MDINHPWTKYEIARLRDEERLLRARAAMRAVEVREARRVESETDRQPSVSLLDRILRREAVAKRAPAESGA
ncbi:MAG: hypothetical protein ACRDPZ_02875 [Gaiellaceae bacterium]